MRDDKLLQRVSKFVALEVRNAMEDFHVEHLSDSQMEKLNPIIRNGIYTGLFVLQHQKEYKLEEWVALTERMIPNYWEEPVLSDDLKTFVKTRKRTGRRYEFKK
jgi:hypothetical protein